MKYTVSAPQPGDCFLLTNGLGGYCSFGLDGFVPRADQGVLVSAIKAPNARLTLVHRLRERLLGGEVPRFLSSQGFAEDAAEDGIRYLKAFSYEYTPQWVYETPEALVIREIAMVFERNTVALRYRLENRSEKPLTLEVTPLCKFAPKEQALESCPEMTFAGNRVTSGTHSLHITTNGALSPIPTLSETLAYPEDAKDGRPEKGMAAACCAVTLTAKPGETASLEIVFSDRPEAETAQALFQAQENRLRMLAETCPIRDPLAKRLAISADAYIARRDSTRGKTILAGYPLFSDWGRDTMIALCGCTLSTGRYEDAKSILRTFLAYEKDGLVPNLFPEGDQAPMYNTVDAALLLIDSVWEYYRRTSDRDFLAEAFPVLERIVACYRAGTHHGIGMDSDGLIFAGQGLDQVTWMDVRINDILPTPRHGKPVEINAYWYNALKIMEQICGLLEKPLGDYGSLAETVKASFTEKFWIPEKGYLKDVLSGTSADEQLRCNQIWALSMTYPMLEEDKERQVLQAVREHLLNECGLRTLSPTDPQYRGHYGGDMFHRDMAYHQGTTWVFPMGAFYRAALRIEKDPGRIRKELEKLMPMMAQGCAGQLPEIYDGDQPYEGKGCFAQAWSVGEMIRVLEDLECN